MDNGNQELGITVSPQKDLATPKEDDVHEIQRQIVEAALKTLQDPRAKTLVYPREFPNGSNHHNDDDYNGGSQTRFIMLQGKAGFGRDEICVALVNNISEENNRTLGSGLGQALQGTHSKKEIGITRFIQTAGQRLRGKGGTYYHLVNSDTVHNASGSSSTKGEAYPTRLKKDTPTYAEHWDSGSAQLAGTVLTDVLGKPMPFEPNDYRGILHALTHSQPNSKLTQKVVKNESDLSYARVEIPTVAPDLPQLPNQVS